MEKPENTSERHPAVHMLGSMDSSERYITDMEKQGQTELVNSQSLPSQVSYRDRDVMEGWGFKFGESFADDPLFMSAELPEGWKKAGTDHDMWSHIVDAEGRKRVAVFYKAAFYDRRADMRLEPRYTIDYEVVEEHEDLQKEVVRRSVVDRQTGTTLKTFTGNYSETDEPSREYLKGVVDDPGHPRHWTE